MLSLVVLALTFAHIHSQNVIPVANANNITIAFGSCLNTFKDAEDIQTVLQSIIKTKSDVWMWLGDAVYLDGDTFYLGTLPGPGYDPNDENYTKSIFNGLKQNPNYVQLKNSLSIIGTWDDHDFGYDDKGGDFKFKKRNMNIFLDFLDEPANSARRSQQGLYTSYYIGANKAIKVILLDVRYNLNSDDMLGTEQWTWLNSQLQDKSPIYTLIGSGTEYLPADRISGSWESNNLERLFDLIKSNKKSGVVLLSGDVHYAEMIRHPCPARVGYKNFYELVSSGMTHSAKILDVLEFLVRGKYTSGEDRYFGKNFALIKLIQGTDNNKDLVFEVRKADGKLAFSRKIVYSDLVYNATLASTYVSCDY